MKRLCLFCFYDRDGIADDALLCLLAGLKPCCTELLFLCNGELTAESRERLQSLGIAPGCIVQRENKGYDAQAYKETLLRLHREGQLERYDELLLANNSVFGPFYPLEELFDEMTGREADFWGVTEHPEKRRKDGIVIPRHVQTYFIGIRKSLFCREEFVEFWEKLPCPESFDEAVINFEIEFSRCFTGAGFRYACYADTAEYVSENAAENCNPLYYHCAELIEKHRVPFLKRKGFLLEDERRINFEKALPVIRKVSGYDTKLIEENIARFRHGREVT